MAIRLLRSLAAVGVGVCLARPALGGMVIRAGSHVSVRGGTVTLGAIARVETDDAAAKAAVESLEVTQAPPAGLS